MNLYWPIVGFAYFINLDVSFSICFFYLLAVIEEGLFNRFGVTISEANFCGTSFVPVGWQMIGVWFTVVGWGLWIARSHLRDVFRKAFKGDAKIDDSDELLSYRSAVFGLLGGLLYMACWFYASGMGPVGNRGISHRHDGRLYRNLAHHRRNRRHHHPRRHGTANIYHVHIWHHATIRPNHGRTRHVIWLVWRHENNTHARLDPLRPFI